MGNLLPTPAEPLRLALIGAGNRAQVTYQPLWEALRPWCRPSAVCDPVKENSDNLAAALGVPAYTDIRQLVRDRPMEAALVVTPVPSHHSISVFLSSNGIPNHTETTWASMVCQAKEMLVVARQNNVIVRVAENFFRMPIDRFAQTVRDQATWAASAVSPPTPTTRATTTTRAGSPLPNAIRNGCSASNTR